MRRFGLISGILSLALGAGVAKADVAADTAAIQEMTQSCAEAGRDVCVVFGATQILTSLDSLNYLYAQDADALDKLISDFERASFKMTTEGRATFRKFAAENAIWVSDFVNERFMARVNPDYAYEDVRHFYAAYQLMRADACDALENAPCVRSALWNVASAKAARKWDDIVERFAISDQFAVARADELLTAYEGQF